MDLPNVSQKITTIKKNTPISFAGTRDLFVISDPVTSLIDMNTRVDNITQQNIVIIPTKSVIPVIAPDNVSLAAPLTTNEKSFKYMLTNVEGSKIGVNTSNIGTTLFDIEFVFCVR